MRYGVTASVDAPVLTLLGVDLADPGVRTTDEHRRRDRRTMRPMTTRMMVVGGVMMASVSKASAEAPGDPRKMRRTGDEQALGHEPLERSTARGRHLRERHLQVRPQPSVSASGSRFEDDARPEGRR